MPDPQPYDPAQIGQLPSSGDPRTTNNYFLRVIKALLTQALGAVSVPSGTGFRHVTGGVEDAASKLVVNADVDANAAIAQSKVSGLPAALTARELLSNKSNDVNADSGSIDKYPTIAALQAFVAAMVAGLFELQGDIDASGNPNYPAASKGDAWVITQPGKIGGGAGRDVDTSDVVVAKFDNPGGTQASVGLNWFILEHNLVGALLAANNLSDVNAALARANLDVPGLSVANTLAEVLTLAKYLALTPNSPAQITADQNNYAPGSMGWLRLSTDAVRVVTGFSGGANGRMLTVTNVGTFGLKLSHDAATSTAANRIYCPDSIPLMIGPGQSCDLVYDGATSRWRVVRSEEPPEFDAGNLTGAVTIDWSNGQRQRGVLSGNVTSITMTNGREGKVHKLCVRQAAAGGPFTITWNGAGTAVKPQGGAAPVMTATASKVDEYTLDKTNGSPGDWLLNSSQNY